MGARGRVPPRTLQALVPRRGFGAAPTPPPPSPAWQQRGEFGEGEDGGEYPPAPDTFWRHPMVPVDTEPIAEDHEMQWFDAQCPEPALDTLPVEIIANRWEALKQLVAMLGFTASIYGVAT